MTLFNDTLPYLSDLAANNNRDWFQEHKARFDKVWEEMKVFTQKVADELNKIDVIESHRTYRIYRDVRFSKNKTPYKNSLGTGFTRATALRRGGFYLEIQPGASFVAGGFWAPNADDLKRIREEFAMEDNSMRAILADPTFVKYFGTMIGDELKTAPRGFDKEHPAIDLIRKKQFLVLRRFTDEEVMSPNFIAEIVACQKAMHPFYDYMSDVLTTNLNGELIV